MKKIITAGAMLLSLGASAQSYMVLNNGVTLTTDRAGFVYDFGNFVMPYKVNVNGGQFLVESDKLSTVDQNGFFYEKDFKVKKVKGKGLNYMVTTDNDIITVDSKGFYYSFEKDSSVMKRAQVFGGNFFVVAPASRKEKSELYTVNSKGNYFNMNVKGVNPAEIAVAGGNFFQTRDGVVHTVNKDGFVFSKPEVKVGKIKKSGGNFFIDASNKLFTVTEDGFLIVAVLPMNLNVSKLVKFGANYMIDSTGKMFAVDSKGVVMERSVTHNLRDVKVLSL